MNRILVTAGPGVRWGAPAGAVRAAEAAASGTAGPGTALVIEFDRKPRPATVLAGAPAKELERRFSVSPVIPEGTVVKARGSVLFAAVNPPDGQSDDLSDELSPDDLRLRSTFTLLALLPAEVPAVVIAGPGCFRELLEAGTVRWDEVLICGRPAPTGTDPEAADPLIRLAAAECSDRVERVRVIREAPGRVRSGRALAGRIGTRTGKARSPGGEPEAPAAESASDADGRGRFRGGRWRFRGGGRREVPRAGESGQATPLVLGAAFVLVLAAIAMVMLGGAITGKARGQRAVDLAALSAVRSMKEDLPRLMAPPTLPNGAPNPYHMPKPVYLARARLAATRNAVANGASPLAVAVRFPDAASWAPVRARVAVGVTVKGGDGGGPHRSREVWAEARLSAPLTMGAVPAVASGGGYSGPLAERQGRGLRPDVAIAFDAMAAAAAAAGVTLVINSAFRSDAEQAVLFAANPDPRMVARPGTSLHRCGTELDLGPPSAYGWLAANAGRFGFVQRYSWEAWHYGFTAGPAPCSPAGSRTGGSLAGGRGGEPRQAVNQTLPGFVPDRYRRPILAAAMRWNVSAPLLAAQLYAESGFNPTVVSSAGAMGIAQFMPGTAASYGLRDPFDPAAAIMAQAHLMSDLLKQFGSPALALAAYNAGPGAVSPCNCIPPYAETRAYVAKILAMLGGAGAIAPMPMEIELVA